MSTRVGVLHARIRIDEKLLLAELDRRPDIEVQRINIERCVLPFTSPPPAGTPGADCDVVLERCISHSRAVHALRMLEGYGVPCVNTWAVAEICGDKMATHLAVARAGIPTPAARVAFTIDAAMQALDEIGYPAVIKPAVGSWGRLLARVNDRDAAEAILEHKATLGTYHHSIFYVQEHIEKPGYDLRTFVVGDRVLCAIARSSEHWITNTSRGAQARNYPLSDELVQISLAAARAIGGGVVAIDLFETPDGFLVNEVNYTMEFRNSVEPTGVDIPAAIVDYLLDVGAGRVAPPIAPAVGGARS